jgi:competence/damage-inducible protein CinA-like protein
MEAEIITIGTELLLGEIVDTNTRFIARALREIGLDIYRTSTVGDNAERIAQAVRESKARAQVVITTGGLGPTVDDATREGIALAFDVPTEFHPELWEQIQERFARFNLTPTDNNRRQAYLPQGAIAIVNPIGTAPGFMIDTEESVVVALQGVPAEMRHLLENNVIPYLNQRYKLNQTLRTRLLRTAGVGESSLDDQIQDLEYLSNPTVGLAAHPGHVDIRITAKADTRETAEEMLDDLEVTIRQRLGDAIYGIDDERLESVAMNAITNRGWHLTVVEWGTDGELTATISQISDAFSGGQVFTIAENSEDLEQAVALAREKLSAEVGLGLALHPEGNRYKAKLLIQTPKGDELIERSYGGPPVYAAKWAVIIALDLLRRRLA